MCNRPMTAKSNAREYPKDKGNKTGKIKPPESRLNTGVGHSLG